MKERCAKVENSFLRSLEVIKVVLKSMKVLDFNRIFKSFIWPIVVDYLVPIRTTVVTCVVQVASIK